MKESTLQAVSNETQAAKEPPKAQPPRRRSIWPILLAIVLLAILVLIVKHLFAERAGEKGEGTPSVAVIKVGRSDVAEDVVLTAEFLPFQEIALHAKVSGFVKWISVDIGDRVKEGQVIAELEVPELQDEINKAVAAVHASEEEVKRSEADYNDAHLNFQRLTQVAKERPKLVAQQEIDNLQARDNSAASALGAARRKVEESQAELSRYKTLLAYASITVPFDGVITKRYADPGALIQAGTSSTQVMPLIDLAQDSVLRLRFPVPESAAPLVHVGESVEIQVSSIGEKTTGKITRFSDKVDRSTRTMVTEVDVQNPDGHYRPGMYAYVRLFLHENKSALAIPTQALATGEKPTTLVVNHDGIVELRPVTIGIQSPDLVEIKTGLEEGDQVIVGSHNGVHPGLKVNTVQTEVTKAF